MNPFAPFLVGGVRVDGHVLCFGRGGCLVVSFLEKSGIFEGMKRYQVYFQYFNQGETGSDAYRFASPEEARAKVEELREAIVAGFDARGDLEVIDEDDFYGIMDRATGDYAKVIIAPGLGK